MSIKNETTIILVRHGQTQWNEQGRLQGHQNSPLTVIGKKQALVVKESLSVINIDVAFVSPLQRAEETMGIILRNTPINPTVISGLKEIGLGPWEGKTKADTKLSHPLDYQHFWHQPNLFLLSGAETYQQLQERMVKVIKNILKEEANKTVLVVSHWIAIKVLLAYFLKIPLNQLANVTNLNNGGFVSVIESQGNIKVSLNHSEQNT